MLPTINVLSNSTVGYDALLNNSDLVNVVIYFAGPSKQQSIERRGNYFI